MGLLQKACETYNYHADLAGVYKEGRDPLVPVSHTLTRAGLEITVDRDGKFVSASPVSKDEGKIIIPVTEESAGRTSGISPHPLCEQLSYVAAYNQERHGLYVDNLKAWAESGFSHPKLLPILKYVEGGSIIDDLAESKLIKLDTSGKPDNEKLLVRWRVVGLGEEYSGPCWTDVSLFEAFQKFYHEVKKKEKPVLCMVEGGDTAPADQHAKGIVATFGNAKLISANDSSNFTYRGRFREPWEAETVGYAASQKAHNALRWLIADGKLFGGRAFICWEPHKIRLPSPVDPFAPVGEDGKPILTETYVPSDYKKQLEETLSGWKSSLPSESAEAVIAAFDAATSGRLSLTYYNELRASDFLERLCGWDMYCCWPHYNFGIQSPSIWEIVNCTFGQKEKGRLSAKNEIMRQQAQRLIACRINGAKIPSDIVRLLAQRVSAPLAYEKNQRKEILFTACAVIRKYHHDLKEEWKMVLEPGKSDRSYQFGRVLAVLEKAERDTYKKDEKREPNAVRMQSVFAQRPMYAARVVWEQVKKAYYPGLEPSSRIYYDKLLGEIMENLSQFPEEELVKPLGDTYILGYYLQRQSFYTKRENKSEGEM